MSNKHSNYLLGLVLFMLVAIIATALGLALYNTSRMQEQKQAQEKVVQFKDKAEVIADVCLKGNHVMVFSVLKQYDTDLLIYVDQAGYKETYSVVIGACNE